MRQLWAATSRRSPESSPRRGRRQMQPGPVLPGQGSLSSAKQTSSGIFACCRGLGGVKRAKNPCPAESETRDRVVSANPSLRPLSRRPTAVCGVGFLASGRGASYSCGTAPVSHRTSPGVRSLGPRATVLSCGNIITEAENGCQTGNRARHVARLRVTTSPSRMKEWNLNRNAPAEASTPPWSR